MSIKDKLKGMISPSEKVSSDEIDEDEALQMRMAEYEKIEGFKNLNLSAKDIARIEAAFKDRDNDDDEKQ